MTIYPPLCRALLFASALATATPAFAQSQEVLMGPAPSWVDTVEPVDAPEDARGMVFWRRQHSQVHLDGDQQLTYNMMQARLLHPNALELGNVAITWNPAAGPPTVHRLRIHRDGEPIDVLADNSFEILRREDQLEAAMIDGLLTAVLRVPDLRVGDELELAYTVPTGNPTLTDRDFGLLMLAPEPAPGLVHLSLSWEDADDKPQIRLTQDLEPLVTRGDNAITIRAVSAEPLVPPRDAPPRYNWQRVLEFSDFKSWSAISSRFDRLFDDASALPAGSPVAQEADRIARTNETPLDRASAALELVARQVRYVYVGLNTGAMTPASAEETWQRRYGDCKGKTALLLALLEELGIEAEAVLVSNNGIDDGLDALLPSPGLFDHVLVRATIDGQQYWLDGTMPGVVTPVPRPILPYRWVLPLDERGAELEELEWSPLEQPKTISLYEIDAREGLDVPASIRQKTITRGIDALAEYVRFSSVTDSQLENAFRNEMAGSTFWDSVDAVTWRFDKDEQASVLEIVGTGMPDWDNRSDDGATLTLPGGGFTPPSRRQRDSGQDQQAPFLNEDSYACHVTTVRLPGDTDPENWSYNSQFDTQIYGSTYRRMFDKRDGSIRMIRISRTQHREISSDLAERDNDRLADFDNSMARIEFDPAADFSGFDAAISRETAVPATYEVNWLEDGSACSPDFGYAN